MTYRALNAAAAKAVELSLPWDPFNVTVAITKA